MKLPSEGELIELENALAYWLAESWNRPVGKTLETLIALARDPSQLLRDIPDDAALDRQLQRRFSESIIRSPRTADPEPVPSLQPKSMLGKVGRPSPSRKKL